MKQLIRKWLGIDSVADQLSEQADSIRRVANDTHHIRNSIAAHAREVRVLLEPKGGLSIKEVRDAMNRRKL